MPCWQEQDLTGNWELGELQPLLALIKTQLHVPSLNTEVTAHIIPLWNKLHRWLSLFALLLPAFSHIHGFILAPWEISMSYLTNATAHTQWVVQTVSLSHHIILTSQVVRNFRTDYVTVPTSLTLCKGLTHSSLFSLSLTNLPTLSIILPLCSWPASSPGRCSSRSLLLVETNKSHSSQASRYSWDVLYKAQETIHCYTR